MTDRDRNELHKLLDKVIDDNEKEGHYQSIIAEMNIYPPTNAFEVRYKKFAATLNLDIKEFYIG